jgi:RNA polymerase sigma factor (sigma-70 family)
MRSSIKPLLPEPETPEQILAEFRNLASDPTLRPELRAEFGQLAVLMEQLPHYEELWDGTAEELGIHQLFQTLPSEEIAKYRALPKDDEEDKLREVVRKRLLDSNREMLEKLPGWDEDVFLAHWCGVFHTALMKEYLRRRDQNETEDGRLIRELLVEESARPEILKKAAKSLTNGLFFLGEQRWRSEDAPAEAILQILERVDAFIQTSPVASNPAAIEAFMEGTLNGIPDQARSHVRTIIETENRRLKLYDRADDSQRESDPKEKEQLVEMVPDGRPSQEEKLLFEAVLAPLEPHDRELAVLYFIEERTQKEIATDYGLTQGAVCKRLEAIRSALKVIREDQSGSSSAQ